MKSFLRSPRMYVCTPSYLQYLRIMASVRWALQICSPRPIHPLQRNNSSPRIITRERGTILYVLSKKRWNSCYTCACLNSYNCKLACIRVDGLIFIDMYVCMYVDRYMNAFIYFVCESIYAWDVWSNVESKYECEASKPGNHLVSHWHGRSMIPRQSSWNKNKIRFQVTIHTEYRTAWWQ